MANEKMQEVGALWRKISERTGNEFFTGDIDLPGGGVMKVVAFRNDRKTKDSQPEFRIYQQEERNGGGSRGGYSGGGNNYQKPAAPSRAPEPVQKTLPKAEEPGYEYPTEDIDPADIPF